MKELGQVLGLFKDTRGSGKLYHDATKVTLRKLSMDRYFCLMGTRTDYMPRSDYMTDYIERLHALHEIFHVCWHVVVM